MITNAQAAAAAAALELGQSIAAEWWQSAAEAPGCGLQVALPSYPASPDRPVVGAGYNLPADTLALRPVERPAPAAPVYAKPAVGGMLHQATRPGVKAGLDGVAWPSARATTLNRQGSSVVFAPARESQPSRLRAALGWLFGH
jgi:hypothetical protein